MRAFPTIFALLVCLTSVSAKDQDYPRNLFNTSGGTPFPKYDPSQLDQLFGERHKIEEQMFDVINEAALRRDPSLKDKIDLFGEALGYVPLLAVAHYRYVFGDKSQLDWLLAEDAKDGFGRDTLILLVYGYMDEWDRTIVRFKEHEKVADGAAGEILHQAIEIRKKIYGAERFEKAWKAAKAK